MYKNSNYHLLRSLNEKYLTIGSVKNTFNLNTCIVKWRSFIKDGHRVF